MPTLTSGIDATWVNSGASYDAGELRRADAAIFSSGGVARGLDVSVTASDVVQVASGSWVIDGESTAEGAGVYRGGIGAQATANLDPRDATYGRIDLVIARQYDPDVVGTHGTYEGAVEVLTGTPSASPSAPALPDLAVELARLDVPVDGGGSVAVDASYRGRAVVLGGGTGSVTLSPTGAYTGAVTASVTSAGVVTYHGFVQRSSGANSTLHSTGIQFPEGFRPAANVNSTSTPFWDAPSNVYRFRVDTDGTLLVQQSGAGTTYQVVEITSLLGS